MCNIVLYCTATHRESIVSWHTEIQHFAWHILFWAFVEFKQDLPIEVSCTEAESSHNDNFVFVVMTMYHSICDDKVCSMSIRVFTVKSLNISDIPLTGMDYSLPPSAVPPSAPGAGVDPRDSSHPEDTSSPAFRPLPWLFVSTKAEFLLLLIWKKWQNILTAIDIFRISRSGIVSAWWV